MLPGKKSGGRKRGVSAGSGIKALDEAHALAMAPTLHRSNRRGASSSRPSKPHATSWCDTPTYTTAMIDWEWCTKRGARTNRRPIVIGRPSSSPTLDLSNTSPSSRPASMVSSPRQDAALGRLPSKCYEWEKTPMSGWESIYQHGLRFGPPGDPRQA
jgi:hypothetical protein